MKTGLHIILFLVITAFLNSCGTTKKAAEPQAQAYQYHTVIKGERIDKIANSYEVTQEEIRLLNPDINFNKLRAGQDIKIPVSKPKVKKEIPIEKKETGTLKKYTTLKIALLLPLNAGLYVQNNQDDNAETTIDASSIPWIQLYNGIEMALDSLSKSGNNYEVTLLDTWMDSTKLSRIIRDSIFTKNDLVISASGNSWLSQLAAAASKNKIPLIVTQNNSASFLEGHPWLYLTAPSVALQCQMMSGFIFRKFEKENLVILHQDIKKENDLAAIFKTSLEIERLKEKHSDSIQLKNIIYSNKLFDKSNSLLDKNKKNIIIIPSSDEAFVSPIISRLDSLKDFRFTICGLPTWENFESIDPRKLQNLQTHIFSSTFIDYNQAPVKNFRKSFTERYKSDPVYNAYLGFSVTYLAGNIMETHNHNGFDNGLENTDKKNYPIFLNFSSKTTEDGKENHHFTILKFDNFKLVVVE